MGLRNYVWESLSGMRRRGGSQQTPTAPSAQADDPVGARRRVFVPSKSRHADGPSAWGVARPRRPKNNNKLRHGPIRMR